MSSSDSHVDDDIATLFPAFPPVLSYEHSLHQDVPVHIYARLRYLYTSLVTLHNASLSSIHSISKAFMQVIHDEQIVMPIFLQERFCNRCHMCLLPGVSCRIRIRPRSRRSKANRSLGKEEKAMRNQVVSIL